MAVETNGAAGAASAPKHKCPNADERTRKRMMALKHADDGRLATSPKWAMTVATSPRTSASSWKSPGPMVWKDVVERYASGGFASIDEDDFERFKWIGLYQQRPKDGFFMLRIKLPGGWVTNERLRIMAGITRDYARGIADISTRQAFQMHWLTIDQMPDIMDRLGEVGLASSTATSAHAATSAATSCPAR
jgi:sulfite reductase beta subunit-like hemoprotein